jgi:hypothetical protein
VKSALPKATIAQPNGLPDYNPQQIFQKPQPTTVFPKDAAQPNTPLVFQLIKLTILHLVQYSPMLQYYIAKIINMHIIPPIK